MRCLVSILAVAIAATAAEAHAQDRLLRIDGYAAFCATHPAECAATGPAVVALTPERIRDLIVINHAVNAAIRYRRVADWQLGAPAGDCRSYAVTKRERLAALGFPRAAMRLAIFWVSPEVSHVVLLVATDRGVLALDNRVEAVTRWTAPAHALIEEPGTGRFTPSPALAAMIDRRAIHAN